MLQVKARTIILYTLPLILTVSLINMVPILYTLYLSFTNNTLFNDEYKFIGLENYRKLLLTADSDLYYVMGLTVLYVVICVSLFVIVGMATALALNNTKVKGLVVWRMIMLLPWAAPSAITALIWKFLFNEDFGPFNQIGRIFFGHNFDIPWVTHPVWAFISVVIVNLWLSYPFFTLVILGALQRVPQELNEAANVDGATAWQRFINITLPLVRPAITPITILSAVTTFQMFTTVYFITGGGPFTSAAKPGATEFVMIYMYDRVLGNAGDNIHYAQIASFAVTIFIILATVTFLARSGSLRKKEIPA